MLSGVAYRQCHPRPIFNDFFSRAKVSAPIACWCYSLRQMAAKMCEAAVSIMAAGICQSFTRQGVKNNRKEVPILQVTPLYLTSIHECESSRQGSSCCTPTTHDAPARRASSPSLMGLHCFSLVDFLPG